MAQVDLSGLKPPTPAVDLSALKPSTPSVDLSALDKKPAVDLSALPELHVTFQGAGNVQPAPAKQATAIDALKGTGRDLLDSLKFKPETMKTDVQRGVLRPTGIAAIDEPLSTAFDAVTTPPDPAAAALLAMEPGGGVLEYLNNRTGLTRRASALAERVGIPELLARLGLKKAAPVVEAAAAPARKPIALIGGDARTAGGEIAGLPPSEPLGAAGSTTRMKNPPNPVAGAADAATELQRAAKIVTGAPLKKGEITPFSMKAATDTLLQSKDERVRAMAEQLLAEGKTPIESTATGMKWVENGGTSTAKEGFTEFVPGRIKPGQTIKINTSAPANPEAAASALDAQRNSQLRENILSDDDTSALARELQQNAMDNVDSFGRIRSSRTPPPPPATPNAPIVSANLPNGGAAASKNAGSATAWLGQFRTLDNVLDRNGMGTVVEPIREAARQGDRWLIDYHDKITALLSTVKRGSPEAIDAARILDGLPVQNPSQQAVTLAQELRSQVFDPIYGNVAGGAVAARVGPLAYVQDYLPRIRQGLVGAGIPEKEADFMVKELYPTQFRSRFFKERPDPTVPYSLDLFEIMPKYLLAAKRETFDIPAYMKAKQALGNFPLDDMGHLAKWYADNFIGQPTGRLGIPNETLQRASAFVSNRVYDALLGLNGPAALLNLGQTALNTFPELGHYALDGAAALATPAGREAFHRSGIMLDYPGLINLSQDSSVLSKARNAIHIPFKAAEYMNRGIAYLGGLAKARSQGLAGDAAEKFAVDVVRKTQFTYGRSSPIVFQNQMNQNPVPGAGMFLQYPLKEADFVWSVLSDGVKKGASVDDRAKAGRMLVMLGGAGALGYNFIGDLMPYLAPVPRSLLDLARFIADTGAGKHSVTDLPGEAINDLLKFLPASAAYRRLVAPDAGSVKEAAPATGVK